MTEALDLKAEAPPEGTAPPLRAMWWLKKGDLAPGPEWERAHEICQTREGDPAHDLVHALAHWIEGDLGNADYWYRRAGSRRGGPDLAAEWDRILAELGGRSPRFCGQRNSTTSESRQDL